MNSNEKTLTLTGAFPEDHGDGEYTIAAIALGPDKNDTAYATIVVKHKPALVDLELISDNATQTVVAGESIDPIVLKFEGAPKIRAEGVPVGEFLFVTNPDNKTSKFTGKVSPTTVASEYKVSFIAQGDLNSDTVYATIVVQAPSSSSIAESSSSSSEESSSSIESCSSTSRFLPGAVQVSDDLIPAPDAPYHIAEIRYISGKLLHQFRKTCLPVQNQILFLRPGEVIPQAYA